jgi:orotate phosphoribosyltransferase-like protein
MRELEDYINEIRDYIDKGYSYNWIAEKLNSNRCTVRKFCIKHNIKSKHCDVKERNYTKEQVRKLYIEQNLTTREVANKLNVSTTELKSFIYANGLCKATKKTEVKEVITNDINRPNRIILNIKIGQVLKLNIAKKNIEDKIIRSKEKYQVINIYPHCVLLAKIINGKLDMNVRICPGLWDLNRMMG